MVGNRKNQFAVLLLAEHHGLSAELTALWQCILRIFPLHLSKVLHLPRKSDARSYEVLRLSHKIISANLKIWCSSMQPLSGNQRSDLLTALTNMSLALRPLPDPLHMSHACHRFWNCYTTLMLCSLLTRCTIPCACHAKRHLNVQKCSVPPLFSALLTSTCCFAPQRRTLFEHLNFQQAPRLLCFVRLDLEMWLRATTECTFSTSQLQKSSEADVLCTFWIGNVLCAATACNFSSLIWPHGPAPAALASLLFDPPEPQIIGKTQRFATFLPFRAPGPSFFWDFLFFDLLSSSLLFSSFLFSSLTLSISASMNMSGNMSDIYKYIYITYIYIYIRYPIFCR